MSRSFKKTVHFSDYARKKTKWAKRQASKKVRKMKEVSNGKWYKKAFETYIIKDFNKSYFDKDLIELLKHYEVHQLFMK